MQKSDNKKIYIVVIIVLLVIIGYFGYKNYFKKDNSANESKQVNEIIKKEKSKKIAKKKTEKKDTKKQVNKNKQIKTEKKDEQTNQDNVNAEDVKNNQIKILLVIDKGDSYKNYDLKIEKDKTVYDMLKLASEQNNFSLKTKDYSFGVFVEEIDGLANLGSGSKNWLYYVNGQAANVGASAFKLKEGDKVVWRFK